GGRVPNPPVAAFNGNGSLANCMGTNPQPVMPVNESDLTPKNWCLAFVGIQVAFGSQEIVENTSTEMRDNPLAVRTARAAADWQQELAEKNRKEDLERSKNVKPAL